MFIVANEARTWRGTDILVVSLAWSTVRACCEMRLGKDRGAKVQVGSMGAEVRVKKKATDFRRDEPRRYERLRGGFCSRGLNLSLSLTCPWRECEGIRAAQSVGTSGRQAGMEQFPEFAQSYLALGASGQRGS